MEHEKDEYDRLCNMLTSREEIDYMPIKERVLEISYEMTKKKYKTFKKPASKKNVQLMNLSIPTK
jgi:hypothetical protein